MPKKFCEQMKRSLFKYAFIREERVDDTDTGTQ